MALEMIKILAFVIQYDDSRSCPGVEGSFLCNACCFEHPRGMISHEDHHVYASLPIFVWKKLVFFLCFFSSFFLYIAEKMWRKAIGTCLYSFLLIGWGRG